MNSKWFPDFKVIIPGILFLMTVTTIFPLPHQVQPQTQQEQAK